MRINKPSLFPNSGSRITQLILVAGLFLFSNLASAQCAMCRAAIESEGDTAKGEAVNDGIVYLMAFPYILVAVICYFIYRTGKKLNKK